MPDPERIVPVPFDRWDDAALTALPTYLGRPQLYAGPNARPMPNVMGLLANHVALGRGWLEFNAVLAKKTALDVRLRELIVLRVAWLTRSAYEWAQHTRIGQQVGLSVDQVHAIPRGADAELWSPVERAVLAATDQLVGHQRVDDDTWALLAQHFDGPQLLEVLFVAGTYVCFAMVCNSAGLQPDPTTERIDAPELPDPPT
ncbi:MAG: 4-carboxymuconolactone decarboxylase [Mycobacterium sp.]|nr:4-carboxymuconolactone decarboxylase [Mycobacterium sp.]